MDWMAAVTCAEVRARASAAVAFWLLSRGAACCATSAGRINVRSLQGNLSSGADLDVRCTCFSHFVCSLAADAGIIRDLNSFGKEHKFKREA
jgi:hypothetical protein